MHLPYYFDKETRIHVLYHPWNQHCIIWVMDMRQNISSGVGKIILREIQNKLWMHFFHDILLGHHKEKNESWLNYCIEEWHTSTSYDIFWSHYNCPTVCLLLDTSHRTDHCITVCGKWMFDSNIEVAFPLKQDFLNYICCGNDTGDTICVGVLRAIRSVHPKVVQRILNMK